MGKMAVRRKKAKKSKKTLAKLAESLKNIRVRVPSPPVGTSFKTIKTYNRRNNKNLIKDSLNGE